MQNTLSELWATLDCVLPGGSGARGTVLGTAAAFRAYFTMPITRARALDAPLTLRRLADRRLAQLARLLKLVSIFFFFKSQTNQNVD